MEQQQTIQEFAEQFNLSADFVKRLRELYDKATLEAIEWQEYREFARRFTDQVISKLKM